MLLAAKAAELAKDLPDGAAIEVTVRVAIKKEHFANLLHIVLSREDRRIVTAL